MYEVGAIQVEMRQNGMSNETLGNVNYSRVACGGWRAVERLELALTTSR